MAIRIKTGKRGRIELDHLRALDCIRLSVPTPPTPDAGQWIVVVGENGVGKTTLLRAIAIASIAIAWAPAIRPCSAGRSISSRAGGSATARRPRTTCRASSSSTRSTRPGEVFVLQRNEHGAVGITRQDVLPGLDANRLLTGDWFGLASTLDAGTLDLLDQHRALLWANRPEGDPERQALEHALRQRARRPITQADRDRVVAEVRSRLAEIDRSPQARPAVDPLGL